MLQRVLDPGRRLAARALRIRPVGEIASAWTALEASGGDLLAAALAYRALFGLLAGLAFACGLIGWVFDDPATRESAVEAIAAAVPGLAAVTREGLATLASGRGALSLIGLLGSAWAASLFYDVLDDAIVRAMPGGRARGVLHRRLRGSVAVVALTAAIVLTLTIRLALPSALEFLLGLVVLALGLLAVYRFVPVVPPTLRAAALPAAAAALAIRVAAEIFGALAPILVQNLQIFGVVVSLLALLLWLGWACRILLLGASWAAVRRDREAVRAGRLPMLDSPAP
jgi:uncharacterized BrkB/YihY/UPF0761 family membrane protein